MMKLRRRYRRHCRTERKKPRVRRWIGQAGLLLAAGLIGSARAIFAPKPRRFDDLLAA